MQFFLLFEHFSFLHVLSLSFTSQIMQFTFNCYRGCIFCYNQRASIVMQIIVSRSVEGGFCSVLAGAAIAGWNYDDSPCFVSATGVSNLGRINCHKHLCILLSLAKAYPFGQVDEHLQQYISYRKPHWLICSTNRTTRIPQMFCKDKNVPQNAKPENPWFTRVFGFFFIDPKLKIIPTRQS